MIGLQHFRYDNISIDLMISMGLVNVLIERLELNTKELTESHNTSMVKNNDCKKSLSADDENEISNPKRAKIDFGPATFIPVNKNLYHILLVKEKKI